MKKFENVAANQNNPHWAQIILRDEALYQSEDDLRSPFERDFTRILHSSLYRRLKSKTQVFYSPANDNICTRIEHVNYVESIAYTIADSLGLNIELTRAIAIAHDVGHSPFGHKGGNVLSELRQRDVGKTFWHEQNGLYMVDNIQILEDKEGMFRNLCLTYGVRDGIISHCGEIDENAIKPREQAINLYDYSLPNEYAPYTWEGCVVKVSDKISYLGRDIEDARKLGLMEGHEAELNEIANRAPGERVTNSFLINYFIMDLVNNSSPEEGLKFSNEALELINKIKAFNYKYIYSADILKPSVKYFNICLNQIYETLKNGYDGENTFNKLKDLEKYYPKVMKAFSEWLKCYVNVGDRRYLKNKVVFDLNNEKDYYDAIIYYISGMTDQYAIDTYNEIIQY